MTLSGSIKRTLELVSVEWEKHLLEQELEHEVELVTAGWCVTVTLPYVDVVVRDYSWENRFSWSLPTFFKEWPGNQVMWLGYAIGLERNDNNFRLKNYGDAEMLLKRDRDHVVSNVVVLEDDNLICLICSCNAAVTMPRLLDLNDGISTLDDALAGLHQNGTSDSL